MYSIEAIQRDSETTKQDLSSLAAEMSSVKAQMLHGEQNKGGNEKKKRIIPTVLSVSSVCQLHIKTLTLCTPAYIIMVRML